MTKIGFIGAGNMGSALARAAALTEDANVLIYDKNESRANDVAREIGAVFSDKDSICKECDFIFLAVKPDIVASLISEITPMLLKRDNYVIVSMAAGVSIESLNSKFKGIIAPIIRIMPNTPAKVGSGMMLWCKNEYVKPKAAELFCSIMAKSGSLDEIPERLIDAATAISGCGPAFAYMFIEALADAGVECGLARDKALTYAAKTLAGAADMVLKTGAHPEALKDAVCSPGGSTIAGVHALEEGSFRATAANAVLASYKKTLSLGK